VHGARGQVGGPAEEGPGGETEGEEQHPGAGSARATPIYWILVFALVSVPK